MTSNLVKLPQSARKPAEPRADPAEIVVMKIALTSALHRYLEMETLCIAGGSRGASIDKAIRHVERNYYQHLTPEVRKLVMQHIRKCMNWRLDWLRQNLNIGGDDSRSRSNAG